MAKKDKEKKVSSKPIINSAEIKYLTPDNSEFYLTEGKLLGLKVEGEDLGRVFLLRMFPYSAGNDFLSVRGNEMVEQGIVQNMEAYPREQVQLMRDELARRYFEPTITEVKNIKEEFGYLYWDVVTTSGERSFAMFDLNNNLNSLGGNSCMLTDVDGSRYRIEDVSKMSAKVLRFLEIWL